MEKIFTHLYITDFGFETTIYAESDFESVEELGRNDEDGVIFIGTFATGKTVILKGYYVGNRKYSSR